MESAQDLPDVSPVVSFPPSFARTFSSKERRLGTRQGHTYIFFASENLLSALMSRKGAELSWTELNWGQDDEKYNPHLICSRSQRFALKFDYLGMYLLWRCLNSDGSWREHQLCQVYTDILDKKELMASSFLVFWRNGIIVHGWQCACSQSPR